MVRSAFIALAAGLAASLACGGDDSGENQPEGPSILLYAGDDLSPTVVDRVEALLKAVDDRPVVRDATRIPAGSLIVSLGDTELARQVIPSAELEALGSEGFILRSGSTAGLPFVAADGNAGEGFGTGDAGDHYAAFALLEELGFAFLHPLEPTLPSTLPDQAPTVDRSEKPYWRIRGLHIHTMHPLELTHLLQGWGEGGPEDGESWLAMTDEWRRTCEWLVANRQNRVHWVLLRSLSWAEFADSSTRQNRLAALVDIAHEYGLGVGVDAPITLQQQNAYHLISDPEATLEEQLTEMRLRIDWILGAGFDYLASENGTSEFTHSPDTRMVAWMNELARYVDEEHGGKTVLMKIHASQGQVAESYLDPETGDPININFLPYHTDPRLGIMPHTVQHYALDDPAPTYGNTDFGFLRDYLQLEVGRREVVWHPESAYWVSFDIDVPLFLPVYGERRFHDLRLLAEDEAQGRMGRGEHAGGRMDGQIVFSSGWEWGYWLGDVIAARAAWDPHLEIADEQDALAALLTEVLAPAGADAAALAELLVEISGRQKDLLIDGEIGGVPPAEIDLRNGQAYMQGLETWDEIAEYAGLVTGPVDTQPRKLGLVDMRNPLNPGPNYRAEIEPLLSEMEFAFADHHTRLAELADRATPEMRSLLVELADAAKMNALRARQVHGLYDYVDGWGTESETVREARISDARLALDEAAVVVARREGAYRVPADRIAGWGVNPTAYAFGYLWTARSLHYWWRDEGKAYDVPISPCYMNIISPVDVGFGEGGYADAAEAGRSVLDDLGITAISGCMSAPEFEPAYPLEGTRP